MLIALHDQCATLQRRTQPASSEQVSAAVSASDNETDNYDQRNSRGSCGYDWAAAVAAVSTPTQTQNRYAVLCDNDDDGDVADPFIVARSRRSVNDSDKSQGSMSNHSSHSNHSNNLNLNNLSDNR